MEKHDAPAERIARAMGFISSRNYYSRSCVTRGELGVLTYLAQCGASSPSVLAEKFNVTTSRIANTLKPLEKKGYVRRDVNPDDHRGIIVTITPEGRVYGKERYQEAIAEVERRLSVLSSSERERLACLVEKLANGIADRDGIDAGLDRMP